MFPGQESAESPFFKWDNLGNFLESSNINWPFRKKRVLSNNNSFSIFHYSLRNRETSQIKNYLSWKYSVIIVFHNEIVIKLMAQMKELSEMMMW